MCDQNTRTLTIKSDPVQRGLEAFRLRCIAIMHAGDLQTIDFDLFVVKYSYSGRFNRPQIIRVVPELLMVSRYEIDAFGRGG